MNFEEIFKDKLWAVRYDSEDQNVLYKLFKDWNDVVWLKDFFEKNIDDLSAYFKITNLNQAIYDTIEDAEKTFFLAKKKQKKNTQTGTPRGLEYMQ